jgi:nitroreductase
LEEKETETKHPAYYSRRESLILTEFSQPAMPAEMGLLKGISTLRSIREFKPDPIPKETLTAILEAATKAASGSNSQPWEFIVVQDPKVKAELTRPMLEKWMKRLAAANMSPRMRKVYDDATEMLRNTEKVPAIIYCCFDRNKAGRSEEVQYASILPAVQNLMLAAHALGLGTCLTVHGSTSTRGEPEVKKILRIPDQVKIACLIYLGYPTRKHVPPRRKPLSNYVHYDTW